jgi:catechol 2,3-dioxygenase-like lactoylglutathione lyase family enzyme/predicted enzyme related to lactoylglutathione lyase
MQRIVSIVLLLFLLVGAAGWFYLQPKELPLGLAGDHLNVVFSVSDAAATRQFYGDILGLVALPDVELLDGTLMLRYLAGKSELQFLVTSKDLPSFPGGTRNAHGIRLLAFLLPEDGQEGILARMTAAGLEAPALGGYEFGPFDIRIAMVRDYDDNQLELVFLDSLIPSFTHDQLQIGIGVSDMQAMDEFLANTLSFEPSVIEGKTHRYEMGKTQIKYWQLEDDAPPWVGSPAEKSSMRLVQFPSKDILITRDAIAARGGKIHAEPFTIPGLAEAMLVEGPDGMLFEFIEWFDKSTP